MDEKTILITDRNGTYQLQHNGITEFALIGILECLLFDLKSANRQTANPMLKESPAERGEINSPLPAKQTEPSQLQQGNEETKTTEIVDNPKEAAPAESKSEAAQTAAAPDLCTRISNAIKAIRALGAKIEDTDLSVLTEEELQAELEELTSQYKRLKSSKGKGV